MLHVPVQSTHNNLFCTYTILRAYVSSTRKRCHFCQILSKFCLLVLLCHWVTFPTQCCFLFSIVFSTAPLLEDFGSTADHLLIGSVLSHDPDPLAQYRTALSFEWGVRVGVGVELFLTNAQEESKRVWRERVLYWYSSSALVVRMLKLELKIEAD